MQRITKKSVINYLVKTGCNVLDATENVNQNFEYIKAHYEGLTVARFAYISWRLD